MATLSVGGYLVTSATIRSDRRAAAVRHAESASVRLHALLDRARAYVVGLESVLEDEPSASQRRFGAVGTDRANDCDDSILYKPVCCRGTTVGSAEVIFADELDR